MSPLSWRFQSWAAVDFRTEKKVLKSWMTPFEGWSGYGCQGRGRKERWRRQWQNQDETKDGALKGRRYVFQGGNQVCAEEQRLLQSSVREPESE
jgi:hypothetical protein